MSQSCFASFGFKWFALPLCVALLAAPSVHGQATRTWDKGAGTLDWNDPLNWSNDTRPGVADTAEFGTAGLATGDMVLLNADQTIGALRFNNSPNLTLSGAGTYGLTLQTGRIIGGWASSVRNNRIEAPLLLGTHGDFEHLGSYDSTLTLAGPITDGGNGYRVVLNASNNYNFEFQGANTYSGETIVQGKTLFLSGNDGAIASSPLVLRGRSDQRVGAILRNTLAANADRLSDTLPVLVEYGLGAVQIQGHPTTAVTEQAGELRISQTGVANLRATYAGASVSLAFDGIQRAPGSGLVFVYEGTGVSPGSNTKLVIDGAVNHSSGMWAPWAVRDDWDTRHAKVDANGCLLPLPDSDYGVLPTSGADPTKPYRTASLPLVLTAAQEVYALLVRHTTAGSLDLGAHDLRVGSGSVGLTYAGSRTIESSGGGRLVFGSQDIVLFARGNNNANVLTISAPISSDVAAPHYLVIPYVAGVGRFALTGEDQIGTYASLVADMHQVTLELGGPSNRTITGDMAGRFVFEKSGAGSLTLQGTDRRGTGSSRISGGRLTIASLNALRYEGYTDNGIAVTNAVLEVAAGIDWPGRFRLDAGSTLSGSGRVGTAKTFADTVRVAPGSGVGRLRVAGATFQSGSHLDWELGTGSATAGTDYDLLRVEGALALPSGTVTVNLYDAGNGAADVKNQTFTLVEWTGTNPTETPTWQLVNHAESVLDSSSALVTVDAANKRFVLTGLQRPPKGTVVLLR